MRPCGCCPRRGCRCHLSLVKHAGRGSRTPLMIDTSQGTWILGQRAMAQNWPALLNDFRSTGNRRLVPNERFSRSFKSWDQLETEPVVWDFLASRLASLEVRCSHQYNPLIYGPDNDNTLLILLEKARIAYMSGDIALFQAALGEGLLLFDRICQILGSFGGYGVGSGLYVEIIETVRQYAPMVAEFDSRELFKLFESVFVMTGRDENTLEVLWRTLAPSHQGGLLGEAYFMLQQERNILAERILTLFGI
jgi:hypothetical protein